MPKLGDIVTYMTDSGQQRMAFVSSEVIEPAKESDEEKQAREEREAAEKQRLEDEKKLHDEEVARQAEASQAAHAEAEARAGGPIQLVASVPPESFAPMPLAPVEEEEEPTGPELTLHVLLHPSDQDYVRLGAFGIYAGVKHSDKNLPHTWH
jgi:hypothetical protein